MQEMRYSFPVFGEDEVVEMLRSLHKKLCSILDDDASKVLEGH